MRGSAACALDEGDNTCEAHSPGPANSPATTCRLNWLVFFRSRGAASGTLWCGGEQRRRQQEAGRVRILEPKETSCGR